MIRKPLSRFRKILIYTSKHGKNLVLAVLLVFFAVAVFSSIFYKVKLVQEQQKFSSYPLQAWQPGEIVQDSRFAFSFNSVRTSKQGIPHFWEAPSGKHFVLVNVSFKNNLNTDFHLSPISSMKIRGSDNIDYPVSSAPTIKNSLGGPVSAFQTVRGEVGFTLPSDIKTGTFIINPAIVGAHQISVHFSL